MYFADKIDMPQNAQAWRRQMRACHLADENALVAELIQTANSGAEALLQTENDAVSLIEATRARAKKKSGVGAEALLQTYGLNTREGVALMCLAEAFLRVPDAPTADALIADKLQTGDWAAYLRKSESAFVNASTWGLLLGGKIFAEPAKAGGWTSALRGAAKKLGEAPARAAVSAAIKILSKQFVLGRTIEEATAAAAPAQKRGFVHSYDMLGEAATGKADAARYAAAYAHAAQVAGAAAAGGTASVSVKLSALHPRYDIFNRRRVDRELAGELTQLAILAKDCNVALSVDAEEADRLELSLRVFEKTLAHPRLRGWDGLGFVAQAYSKRAAPLLLCLNAMAKERGARLPLRLVKGAYWDYEIKQSQQQGLEEYPVFTRKATSDLSFLACARLMFERCERLLPQIATHNAHTAAAVLRLAGGAPFEFQRLHGMGEELHEALRELSPAPLPTRIYAPVGSHEDLLPYLARRLLENGANSSFTHKLLNPQTPPQELAAHPLKTLRRAGVFANPRIVRPPNLFAPRKNSGGVNLHIAAHRAPLFYAMRRRRFWRGAPLIAGKEEATGGEARAVFAPFDGRRQIGEVCWATPQQAKTALAAAAASSWGQTPVAKRAAVLEKLADLLEANRNELVALCAQEAGKTAQDGVDEVREAADFCRYYAMQARRLQGRGRRLRGVTGEANILTYEARGVFVCISPWNFPLAIFLGQVAAALVAGNAVVAKPAEQTGLVASACARLALQAGVLPCALHLLPGSGQKLGAVLCAAPQTAGVCFTGSTAAAVAINRALAARDGALATLIAETGGQNAMVADNTALPEQLAKDVIYSAFGAAGQRCSALRVLYLQQETAQRAIDCIAGAMDELVVGSPLSLQTDIGPLIDEEAANGLRRHIAQMQAAGNKKLAQARAPAGGNFVPPTAFEVGGISELKQENFGPVLHIARYNGKKIEAVVGEINAAGYGLTFGAHTRNRAFARRLGEMARAGNVYINRNQIGAVVGAQPFGGRGLSGTGPKAGGPNYLLRFVCEKLVCDNIAAVGGNAELLQQGEG